MTIRDVEITFGEKNTIRWPLDETEGTIVHSIPDGFKGVAFNQGKHGEVNIYFRTVRIAGI